jgi:hypothetical protein
MYKIKMYIPTTGTIIDMPSDHNLPMKEAIYRINLYKKRNPDCSYFLADEKSNKIYYNSYNYA